MPQRLRVFPWRMSDSSKPGDRVIAKTVIPFSEKQGSYALFTRVSVCAEEDYILEPGGRKVFGIIYEKGQNTRLSFRKDAVVPSQTQKN